MTSSLQAFMSLPTPLKAAFGLLSVTSFLGAAYIIAGFSPKILAVLLFGLALVAAILYFYRLFLRISKKRKAKPFVSDLSGNTGAVPQGISEAASRARLDELRKKFEQGVEIFRQHGKEIYSLPWFMIVGEPGSGKTEALRHSNVGFPPGLQDELQGSGGTINMDWWFTNNAIILDTAGRLMFEEASGKSNTEWKEFLTLLSKHRPNCPVNGLMLVIPADSLIRDSADEINNKGGRIARQLDLIQRTLGVRFPVFVLITKADLVLGFREFFDELNDPQLQHQILGWSNPDDLDTPFRPELVEQHLTTVRKRLERRRLGLMIDPVSKEGAMARRANEVDALYAFPDSLLSIAPRLRRYLELVFVSGEWSTKPLFLRGIYFVSSMREGSALDAGLAEALGMPVDQLPEGRIWERDRSYFLRDLFLEKMFRERGLITRTNNTSQLRRRRRGILLGSGCVAAVLLIALTWMQARQLSGSIGQPASFWKGVASAMSKPKDADAFPVVVAGTTTRLADRPLAYTGREEVNDRDARIPADLSPLTVVGLQEELLKQVARPIDVPWIFRPVGWLMPGDSANLYRQQRLAAGRRTFELTVLTPLITRAMKSMALDEPWSPDASAALAELLKFQARHAGLDHADEPIQLLPIFRYVLRPEAADQPVPGTKTELARAEEDVDRLQRAFDQLLANGDGWPGDVLPRARPNPSSDLRAGVERFLRSRENLLSGQGEDGPLAAARRLEETLSTFRRLEDSLLNVYAPAQPSQPISSDPTNWTEVYPGLAAGFEQLQQQTPLLGGRPFPDWYREQSEQLVAQTMQELDRLRRVLPEAGTAEEAPTEAPATRELRSLRRRLDDARSRLQPSREAMTQKLGDLTELQESMLVVRGDNPPAYAHRFNAYRQTEELRLDSAQPSRFAELPKQLDDLHGLIEARQQTLSRMASGNITARIDRSVRACVHVLGLFLNVRTTAMVTGVANSGTVPETARDMEAAVASLVQPGLYNPDRHPTVPLTRMKGEGAFSDSFHRLAAPAAIRALRQVEAVTRDRGQRERAEHIAGVREEYARRYVEYWRDLVKKIGLDAFPSWREYHRALADLRFRDVNTALDQLLDIRRSAIEAIGADGWGESTRRERDAALNALRQQQQQLDGSARFNDDCGKWIENWRGLTNDPDFARRRLLGLDVATFNNGHIHLLGGAGGGVPVDYWEMLTLTGLETLADESNRAFAEARRTLAGLRWFPLRRLSETAPLDQLQTQRESDETRVLSPEELVIAREALAKLRPENVDPAERGDYAPNTVGHPGTRIGVLDVDTLAQRLRGGDMPAEDLAAINRLARVLRELPADAARPLQYSITVLGTKEPSRDGLTRAGIRFPYLQVSEQTEHAVRNRPEVRITAAEVPVGDTFTYPGGVMEFKLSFEQDGGRVLHTVKVNGPWAALALIHRYNGVQPNPQDPTLWDVEVIVPYANTNFSLWLRIKFQSGFPSLTDWPR